MLLREVFWGQGVNNTKKLVAIETDLQQLEIQHIYVTEEQAFDSSADFHAYKDQLFDVWREGGELSFPPAVERSQWDISTQLSYPEKLPMPEQASKKESLAKKMQRNLLHAYSEAYKADVKVGLMGFRDKIMGLTTYKQEEREFSETFDKLIRAGMDAFEENEAKGEWNSECLSKADAKELRDILGEIREKLNSLRTHLWEQNFHEISEKIREFKEKLGEEGANWKNLREEAFDLKNELIDLELGREQKDGLMTHLKGLIQQIADHQQAERAALESNSSLNFGRLNAALEEVAGQIPQATFFQPLRESLKKVQTEIFGGGFTKEHRSELMDKLDLLFKEIAAKQDKDKAELDKYSTQNFEQISERLVVGKKLAQFNDDFQETREMLKLIQQDITEAKLSRDHRESLRKELDEAFKTLNQRADRFYQDRKIAYEKRQKENERLRIRKRQEWEFRIKEKIQRADKNIRQLEKQIQSDQNFVERLQEKWEDTGDEKLKGQIARVQTQIEERQAQILVHQREVVELEEKLKQAD